MFKKFKIKSHVHQQFAEDCDEIRNTVRSGIKILTNVSETTTNKTIKSLNTDLKDVKESLVEFNSSVAFEVKNFISTTAIDEDEESKLPNLENYVEMLQEKVEDVLNSVVETLNSTKINEDYINLHHKHIDTIKENIENETEMFEKFLNQTNVPRDCAIFKFQNKITNLLTSFEQSVPTFFDNIAKAQKDQLIAWKTVLKRRNSTISASFKGCLMAQNVKCCVNDFVSI